VLATSDPPLFPFFFFFFFFLPSLSVKYIDKKSPFAIFFGFEEDAAEVGCSDLAVFSWTLLHFD
jgi:hypothetical protein